MGLAIQTDQPPHSRYSGSSSGHLEGDYSVVFDLIGRRDWI